MLAEQETDSWVPVTESDKAAVLAELDYLLQHQYFNQSKRYPHFLRFVVSHALEGVRETFKERALGIEIFGKTPDYDTAADPVVRVTAAEIRKRLALYYKEAEHSKKIRIVLPSGSYSPKFYRPVEEDGISDLPLLATEEPSPATAIRPGQVRQVSSRARVFTVLFAVLVIAGSFLVWRMSRRQPSGLFWSPLLSSTEPVLFCIADQEKDSSIVLGDAADPRRQSVINVHRDEVGLSDLPPLINMTGIMQVRKHAYHIKGTSATTLDDLRQGPTVLIGSFDNSWTLRLTQPLRYHFANDPEMTRMWIADRQNPDQANWVRDSSHFTKEAYDDYAVVARFIDPNTDHFVVVVAGLGHGGTMAAGEFLVASRYTDELMRQAPKNWDGRGIEVVLQTAVMGNQSGAPRVVATYFW